MSQTLKSSPKSFTSVTLKGPEDTVTLINNCTLTRILDSFGALVHKQVKHYSNPIQKPNKAKFPWGGAPKYDELIWKFLKKESYKNKMHFTVT